MAHTIIPPTFFLILFISIISDFWTYDRQSFGPSIKNHFSLEKIVSSHGWFSNNHFIAKSYRFILSNGCTGKLLTSLCVIPCCLLKKGLLPIYELHNIFQQFRVPCLKSRLVSFSGLVNDIRVEWLVGSVTRSKNNWTLMVLFESQSFKLLSKQYWRTLYVLRRVVDDDSWSQN